MDLTGAMVPKEVFLTKGAGTARTKLQSLEVALRRAGIQTSNLVRCSSILPPACKIISRGRGVAKLRTGQVTFCVLAEISSDEPSRLLGAGIGLAVPADRSHYGYISEHHCFGMTRHRLSDFVEDQAATMLATTLGIAFDPDKAYDQRREVYRMSGEIIRTQASVQTAGGDKNGLWTTCIAAAVFLL